ncbi:MAG: hypothetical protein HYZ53_12425, partial [Planctomycetes bacterium]|nr:hypothetical protein [Planctomycetota bacterium]
MRTRSVSWSASPIRFLLTLAACALAASGVALAQTPPANPPAAQPPTQPVGPPTPPPGAADPTLSQLEAARRAMAERNYAAAADAFAAFVEKAPTSPRADEAAFLAARARFLAAK